MNALPALKSVGVLPGAFDEQVKRLFWSHPKFRVEYNPRRFGCDLLVLTGGEDINPKLYGEKPIPGTSYSVSRDSFEQGMVEFFAGTPMIGICRGAQLLNVLFGGSMWQDTDGHHMTHPSFDKKHQQSFRTSSIHHQMMRPGPKAEVLLVADQSSFVESEKELLLKDENPFDDIEALVYPEEKVFCFQGHPEIGTDEEKQWFFDRIHEYLGV